MTDAHALHTAFVTSEKQANAADAARLAHLHSFYQHRTTPDPGTRVDADDLHRSAISEAAAAIAVTDRVIDTLLVLWTRMLPAVQIAFLAGAISLTKIRVIDRHTAAAPRPLLDTLDEHIAAAATVLAPGPLGTEINRLLTDADTDWAHRAARAAARSQPCVRVRRLPHDLAEIRLVLPAVDTADFTARLDTQIRRICLHDPTTIDYVRSRAAVAVITGTDLTCSCGQPRCAYPTPGSAGTPYADRPHGNVGPAAPTDGTPRFLLQIGCDLEQILGLGSGAALLHGYGPISAATIATLHADSAWQAIFHASRRYLDTLTGGDPYYGDETPPPEPTPPDNADDADDADDGDCPDDDYDEDWRDYGEVERCDPLTDIRPCMCSCGAPGCAGADLTPEPDPDQLRITDILDTEHHRTEQHSQAETGYRDDTVTLGRSRRTPAGHTPDPEPTPRPDVGPTASQIIDHWTSATLGELTADTGHGGFTTPPPGALTYRPSAALTALVRAQHPTCLHPGCSVPSDRCDLDHTVPYDHRNPLTGGWTINANLGPLCRRHHNLKTAGLWNYHRLPNGAYRITDPLGHHYYTPSRG